MGFVGGALVGVLVGAGCNESERVGGASTATEVLAPAPTALGLLRVQSTRSAADSAAALSQALDLAELSVPLELDHRGSAQGAGLEMLPSRVFVFGNAALGTPLMQENILAALDLPLKMLVSEDAGGVAHLDYDGPDYLRRRHGLAGVDRQLERAAGALANLASAAAGVSVAAEAGEASGIDAGQGIVVVESTREAPATLAALRQAIEQSPALNVVAQVDHQAAAAQVGLPLGFATVVIFGSPAVGTPLMQAAPSIGLDLPLKMLVAEREGSVVVAHNSPRFLAERHGGLAGQEPRLEMMTTALERLAAAAAGL